MLINRDDAIAAIEAHRVYYEGTMLIEDHHFNEGLSDAIYALRALPTVSDGWEDIATDKLDAWRFNVMLECQDGDGERAVGGAVLNLNDLLAILVFVSDRCPLPAPPSE